MSAGNQCIPQMFYLIRSFWLHNSRLKTAALLVRLPLKHAVRRGQESPVLISYLDRLDPADGDWPGGAVPPGACGTQASARRGVPACN